MTGITVNVEDQHPIASESDPPPHHPYEFPDGYHQRFLAMVSPRNPASARSAFFTDGTSTTAAAAAAAPFLRSCWLCNRRLAPGRDIYMYRGDTAFCSLECREKQMKKDERKEKLNMNAIAGASEREDGHGHGHATSTTAATSSKTSKAEPVVAA
ncbi:hypothetical protein V6N11_059557 [Hibiscus sabdariffa]|uniref:FLZ-type domain-containing protein n=1 Tax=Hibiscus sabdariffa TaxID=183260 RepID=A0ABR2NPD8_9ROSI